MKVLITGASGFIASHLIDYLLKKDYQVVALIHKLSQIKRFKKWRRKNLRVQKVDITKSSDLKKEYFRGIDWVFHLAGKNFSPVFENNPMDYHNINVNGTLNILAKANESGVKKFVYTASASCYGNCGNHPSKETDEVSLGSHHAFTKYIGELYTLHWGKIYKLPVISLRLFSLYGPKNDINDSLGPLFDKIASSFVLGLPVKIYGDGSQSRDLVYIDDVIEAFIKAASSNLTNEIFNVGSGRNFSLNQIVKLINTRIEYLPRQEEGIKKSHADIDKIKRLLGWKPKVTLEEGVKKVLESLKI